jgi:hypothetical protein
MDASCTVVPMRHKKPVAKRPVARSKGTIPFRPNPELRALLEAEKDASGAPFQKIIEKALAAYLASRA